MGFGDFNDISSKSDFEYRINSVFFVTLERDRPGFKVELGDDYFRYFFISPMSLFASIGLDT